MQQRAKARGSRIGPTDLPGLSVRGLLRGSLPRILRSSLGPIVTFYVGLRIGGLGLAVAAASVVAIGLYAYERRMGRPGLLARVTLGVLLLQAALGLVLRNVFAYFTPAPVTDLVIGAICFTSLLVGRPLARPFTGEILLLSSEIGDSPAFDRLGRRLTFVWACYFALRGVAGLAALATRVVEVYVAVAIVLDAPVVAALLAWTLAYSLRTLRSLPAGVARR